MVLRSRLIAIGLTVVLVSVLIFSVSAANSPITTNSGITPDLRTPPPNPQPPATLQSILNAVNNIVPTLEVLA
jgi:hypothetical protein